MAQSIAPSQQKKLPLTVVKEYSHEDVHIEQLTNGYFSALALSQSNAFCSRVQESIEKKLVEIKEQLADLGIIPINPVSDVVQKESFVLDRYRMIQY